MHRYNGHGPIRYPTAEQLADWAADAVYDYYMANRQRAHDFLGQVPNAVEQIAASLVKQYGPNIAARAAEAATPLAERAVEIVTPVLEEKARKWVPIFAVILGITTGVISQFIWAAIEKARRR